jgi:heat shock protein HslJ
MSRAHLLAAVALASFVLPLPEAAKAQGLSGNQWRGATESQTGGAAVPQGRQEKIFPIGASWTAVSVNGRPFSGERPTLIIDQQLRGKGFAGCNTFSATAYPLREQALAVGPVAVTRRACEKTAMDMERAFLVALRSARRWDIVEGRLIIQGMAGELRFERAL